jgi:hypothetical protein
MTPVPFQHGEFGVVEAAALIGSPAVANLEYPSIAGSQESLHAEFGRGVKEAVAAGEGIDVELRGRGRNEKGGIHFEIPPLDEELSAALDDAGTGFESAATGGKGAAGHGQAPTP